MANDDVEACALKRRPYTSAEEQASAQAELLALRVAQGMPHIIQGLAAFEHVCSESEKYLYIATRSALLLHSTAAHCCTQLLVSACLARPGLPACNL